MRPTRLAELAVPFVVVGGVVYAVLRSQYGNLPPLHYATAIPLAALAVIEFITARRVRAAVRHDPDANPMAAIFIARCVALGKATALVGAALSGAVVGLLARVAPDAGRVTAAADDLAVAIVLLVASVALTGAGIFLERAGVDPGDKDRSPVPDR